MKIILLYKDAPNPLNLPGEWPASIIEDDERDVVAPWFRCTDEELQQRLDTYRPAYDARVEEIRLAKVKILKRYADHQNPLNLPAEWPAEVFDDDGRQVVAPYFRCTVAELEARIAAHKAAYNAAIESDEAPKRAAAQKAVDWQATLDGKWTDGVTGIALRQDDQTHRIVTALLAASVEGIANGSLTVSTQIQIRDANGAVRSGTVTQLRGLCYRYLTAWLSNYISKAP